MNTYTSFKIHFYYFDILRFFAALSVLMGHARCEIFATYLSLHQDSQNLFTKFLFAILGCLTQEGMCLFFLMSGFLVGGPMLSRLSNTIRDDDCEKKCTEMALSFSKKRFIRIIFPLSIALLFAVIVKSIAHKDYSIWDAFLNLFGLQGILASDFGWVYWSLAYEIWFYVLLFSIVALFSNTYLRYLGFVLLLLTGFVFIKLPIGWFLMLLLGTLGYFVRNIRISKLGVVVSVLMAFIAFFIRSLATESHVIDFPLVGFINPQMIRWVTSVCLMVIMVKIWSIPPANVITSCLEKAGNKLASFTYSLYITHFTVLELFKACFGQFNQVDSYSISVYFLVCFFCLMFGYGFYWVVETKCGEWLRNKLM